MSIVMFYRFDVDWSGLDTRKLKESIQIVSLWQFNKIVLGVVDTKKTTP